VLQPQYCSYWKLYFH